MAAGLHLCRGGTSTRWNNGPFTAHLDQYTRSFYPASRRSIGEIATKYRPRKQTRGKEDQRPDKVVR